MAHATNASTTTPGKRGAGYNKPACDRCRGQKLRCIWESDSPKCHRCTRAGTMCVMPPRRPIGRPPSQINNVREQSFGWEDYMEDENRPSDANSSILGNNSVASVMNLLSDDAQWAGLSSAPTSSSTSTFSNAIRSNSFSSPSPNLQLDLGELINDAMGPNDPNTPRFTSKSNHGFVGPAQTQNYDIPPTPPSIGGDVRMLQADPMPMEGSQLTGDEEVNYIRQLCDIHGALVRHPLYGESLTRQTQPQAQGQTQTGTGSRISDLQLGRLFALTVQLTGMTGHVSPIEGSRATITPRPPLKNSATILLALSCYVRLDQLYSRAVDLLRELHDSDQRLDDSYQLMSGLTIDGFSLGACHEFQLGFVLQLCEKTRQRLGATVHRLRTNQ
ncbi:hypothetical protein F4810DRAFT_373977 [Camillea tinctor]|nr:hypothetical protein F4810DRAFT_373977 [Camillea tinctor]